MMRTDKTPLRVGVGGPVGSGKTALIERLLSYGVNFSRDESGSDPGGFALGREGGHSNRLVAHYKDVTGAEVQRALLATVAKHHNITILDNHIATTYQEKQDIA